MVADHKPRVPTGPPELDELDKFRAVLLGVLLAGQPMIITCQDETEAKRLRRRLYSLRDSLSIFERDAADSVAFAIVGHRVHCTARPRAHLGSDWTLRVNIGAPAIDTSNQGDIPRSDRLDDAGGPGKL